MKKLIILMLCLGLLVSGCYEDFTKTSYCTDLHDLCDDYIYSKCYECKVDFIDGKCEEPIFIYYQVDDNYYYDSMDMINELCLKLITQ